MDLMSKAFEKPDFIEAVQNRVPDLLTQAELDARKYGKIGLNAGIFRKKAIIDFLALQFNTEEIQFPDRPDIDLIIDKLPVKIRTITGTRGIKIKWTIDRDRVLDYAREYKPLCGILLIRKRRVNDSKLYPYGMFWIPLDTQLTIFKDLKSTKYLKLPKIDTNSRGIELSHDTIDRLLKDKNTKHIPFK